MAERFSPATRALLARAQDAARRDAVRTSQHGTGLSSNDGTVRPAHVLSVLRAEPELDRCLQCLAVIAPGRAVVAAAAAPAGERPVPAGSFDRATVRALVAAAEAAAARGSATVAPVDVFVGMAQAGVLTGVSRAEIDQAVEMARAGYLPV